MATEIFYGFELLLMKRFQSDLRLWHEWKLKLLDKAGECFGCIDALEDLGVRVVKLTLLVISFYERDDMFARLLAYV